MSKRNIILITIILVALVAIIFGISYFKQPSTGNESSGGGLNFLSNFLPFGKSKTPTNNNNPQGPANVSGGEYSSSDQTQNGILKKVSSFPIAGFGVFQKERYKDISSPPQTTPPDNNTGNTPSNNKTANLGNPSSPATEFVPALRYVNRATGNIYQTFADKIDERRFSGTVIPKVYEAYFGNNGDSVVMRYLKDDGKTIETFVGSLPKEVLGADTIAVNDVNGSFLPENISDISISPDASKMFYLFNTGDSSVGVIFTFSTNGKTQIFDSPFTEWLSLWPSSNLITLTTKPSSNYPGFVYALNTNSKNLNKILGNVNGMTTLASPNGKELLYSDNNLSLNILNIDTGNSISMGINTLPEKCVWGSASDTIYCAVPKYIDRGEYPDSWYQGTTSFSDEIWKIDVATGNTTKIADPSSLAGEDVDGIKLALDNGENYLFFVNKKDSYLWELKLK